MTEKIYPTHEADYPHANRLPTAPPLHGSTAAIQMPEKAVRKEQEEGLMSQYEHAQTRQADDHIYTIPPPVYPSNGEKGGSYAAPVGGHRRRRRQRSGCCCFLISFAATLGTLILIAGIAALVVYLVLRPIRKPKYSLQGVEVREFDVNLTNGGASELNTQMDLRVEASNPNKKIGIDYNDIEVEVFYEGEKIGEGSIPGFYQGHRNKTLVAIPIEGHNVILTSTATSALQSNASVWMTTEATTRARVKIGRWKSWRRTFHLRCSFHINSSPHRGSSLQLLSSSCKLKKPRFLLFGFIRF